MSETKSADKSPTSSAVDWDLTSSVSPYLDLHMMFPLLEYMDSLISTGAIPYASSDVATARLSLLRPTHMVDYAMDIYKELHGDEDDIPVEMEEQKVKVLEQMTNMKDDEGVKAFNELCQNTELRTQLLIAGQWNIGALSSKPELKITSEVIKTYREQAKFNFDCGDYQTSKDMLANIISLYAVAPLPKDTSAQDEEDDGVIDERSSAQKKKEEAAALAAQQKSTGNPNVYYLKSIDPDLIQILWGKLSCEILLNKWDEASVALTAVQLSIEQLATTKQITALEALTQRTWLLHWSLFVFWNNSGSKGLESMVELFFSDKYLQAITTNAPHLLRYLTAAVLLCKRRMAKNKENAGSSGQRDARKLMKDLVRVMQNCEYTDPIVEFVDCLCVKFDFESAQVKLSECELVLSTDFFLCKQTALFMEEARVFVFENYCRIHNKIDLEVLGAKLAMNPEAAERWIVDLIRNALLDAKIDSEEGCVVMGEDMMSIYEQVKEKTRDLNLRSVSLVQNLKTSLNDAKKEKAKRARAAALEAEEY